MHRPQGTITPQLAEYGITLLGNYRGLPIYASESPIYGFGRCVSVLRTAR